MLQEGELVDQLSRSTVYQNFERAFCEATQFSLRLAPPKNRSWISDGEVHQFWCAAEVPVRLGDKTV